MAGPLDPPLGQGDLAAPDPRLVELGEEVADLRVRLSQLEGRVADVEGQVEPAGKPAVLRGGRPVKLEPREGLRAGHGPVCQCIGCRSARGAE